MIKYLNRAEPIKHGFTAEKHTPLYTMHRYFARRPHNVFYELIQHYCDENSIVLDLFMGGGVTVIESLRAKRKVVGVDLNPLATFVTKMSVVDCDPTKITSYYEQVRHIVENKINSLYSSNCSKCDKENIIEWFGWDVVLHCNKCKKDNPVRNLDKVLNKKGRGTGKYRCTCKNILSSIENRRKEQLVIISFSCTCGFKGGKHPDNSDSEQLNVCDKMFSKLDRDSYPHDKIPAGDKFNEALRKGYKYFYELFTKRNIVALSLLKETIDKKVTEQPYHDLLKLAFSQTLAGATKMCNDKISGWEAHAYWIPDQMFELNVWSYFRRNIKAVIEGKIYSHNNIGSYAKHANRFDELKNGKTYLLLNKSSTNLNEINDNSVDVVITDPPYGGNVNYTELSDFWAIWMRKEFGMSGDTLIDNKEEAIINKSQRKCESEYEDLLYKVLKEVHKKLKKDGWLVMTFHNKKFSVWKSLHKAAYYAGFALPPKYGIIYQSPIVAYTYTIHQREVGSMLGDFIVSYKRIESPAIDQESVSELTHTEKERLFEEIHKVIEFHGGATENTIFTQIMPFLMNSGILHKIGDENLEGLLDTKEFVKIDDKWYLQENIDERGKLRLLDLIPAERRIEELILSLFKHQDAVSMDDILKVVFSNLINGDTPTGEEIQRVIDRLCIKENGGGKSKKREVFKLKKTQKNLLGEEVIVRSPKKTKVKLPKQSVKMKKLDSDEIVEFVDAEQTMHTKIIKELYELGTKKRYRVHIGETEQRKDGELKKISFPLASNIQIGVSREAFRVIKEIDVLWLSSGNTIVKGFEVEASTNIVTGIQRFRELFVAAPNTNIDAYILVPDKRKSLAISKINSPANRKDGISDKIKLFIFSNIRNIVA